MGSSKSWPDALQAFTGEHEINSKAVAEYFEPLRVWLEAENKKHCVYIGWTESNSKFYIIFHRKPIYSNSKFF